MDVRVEVKTPGGHSSLPPPHTVGRLLKTWTIDAHALMYQSIGILAQLLVKVEANPFKPHLVCPNFRPLNVYRLSQQVRGSPMYKFAQCLAVHSPGLPKRLRKDILRSEYSDKALRIAEKQLLTNTGFKVRVSTTQAIDMIQGGVKVNALPEQAWAVINHRISTERRVITTIQRNDCLTLTNQALWTKPSPTPSICSGPSPMLSTYHTLHSVLILLIQRLLCMAV